MSAPLPWVPGDLEAYAALSRGQLEDGLPAWARGDASDYEWAHETTIAPNRVEAPPSGWAVWLIELATAAGGGRPDYRLLADRPFIEPVVAVTNGVIVHLWDGRYRTALAVVHNHRALAAVIGRPRGSAGCR